MILIIGASGMLGSALCKRLSENGQLVRAVTRKPEIFNKAACPHVEVVYGDLTVPQTLENAFVDAEIVVACAHSLFGKGKNSSEQVDKIGHKNLIKLCLQKNIKHFIYTSMYGVSADFPSEFIQTKYEVEQFLKQSGLPYTIIRPTAFMEMHAQKLIGENILKKGKVKIFGYGKNLHNFVAVNDVATLIAAVISQNPANRTLEIGSPTNISKTELAQLYGKYMGKPPRVSYISPRALRTLSTIIKPLHPGISRVMKMSATLDETNYSYNLQQNIDHIPFQPKTIDAFVKEQVYIALQK